MLPAVKAIMARSIVEKHGYSEKKTADLLGLSQSAVSRYVGRERGHNLLAIESTEEILNLIDEMVASLIKNPADKTAVLELFCRTCIEIRQKGLMCHKCKQETSPEWTEKCLFCR